MTHSVEQIIGIVERRRRDRYQVIETMRMVRSTYNDEIVVPLPEMDQNERSAVPNLILQGIDQNATRIASVTPSLDCPPADPASVRSRKKADTRRQAILGWWEHSDLDLAAGRRARWLVGYGAAPAIIRPDFDNGVPVWEIRDPLDAYPPPSTGNPGKDLAPPNCAFLHRHTYGWLAGNYPNEAAVLANGRNPGDIDPSEPFEVIEWFDADETVLIGLANQIRNPWETAYPGTTHASYVQLGDRVPNLTGICPVTFPGRITLDRPRGQFDASIGMYQAHAKLMALAMIATEKDVFPDQFLVSRQPGETPRFLTGQFHDGRTGFWNEVDGLPQIIHTPMGPLTGTMLDRVERGERLTGGTPSELGGESGTNIRTGRRGEQVLEAAISFPIAEAQKLMARAVTAENKRAQAVARAWFGQREKTIFVEAIRKSVSYIPDRDFDTDVSSVTYPIAGTDANNLTIMLGQLNGTGLLSQQSSRRLHPLVSDAEFEKDQVMAEQLDAAQLAGLQAMAQSGQIPPADLAKIRQLVASDRKELFEAVIQVQKEAQERQASAGQPGTPAGPVAEGAPEAQPGLAVPGAGAEQPTAPPQGQPDLNQFLAMLGG